MDVKHVQGDIFLNMLIHFFYLIYLIFFQMKNVCVYTTLYIRVYYNSIHTIFELIME